MTSASHRRRRKPIVIPPSRYASSPPKSAAASISSRAWSRRALTANLGQQVIVDNRPSGVFTGSIVSKASPDGYTLLFNGSSFWLLPFLQANVPYDPVKDFAPITLATNSPCMLVVHPGLPVKSREGADRAGESASPASSTTARALPGTPQHIAAELFKSMAGVNIVRIPYKGAGPAIVGARGRRGADDVFERGAAVPHIKSGQAAGAGGGERRAFRARAGPADRRVRRAAGFRSGLAVGLLRAGEDARPASSRACSSEIVSVLNKPDVKEKLFNATTEVVGQLAGEVRGGDQGGHGAREPR